ncbi:MAG: C40 family peptidase [Burkholderiales bacterium]
MKMKKLWLCFLLGMSCLITVPQAVAVSNDDDDDAQITEPVHAKDAIGNMLLQSVSLMGIPYRWGGNTPETGMDCSGFIRYVFKKSLGITLPRTAAEMAKVGKRVSLDDLEPGDLIFFNTARGSNTHIGMYIGDSKFIQSPRTGETIQITQLNGYWRSKINGAKRIVQESEDDDGNTTVEEFQDVRNEALPTRYRGKARAYARRHYARIGVQVRRSHHGQSASKAKARKVVIKPRRVKASKAVTKSKKVRNKRVKKLGNR